MPQISKEQMDKDEVTILAELQKNSDESIDKIAKKMWFFKTKGTKNHQAIRRKSFDLGGIPSLLMARR